MSGNHPNNFVSPDFERTMTCLPSRRHWMSFTLRTALLAVTVFGIWLGLHFRSVRRQQESTEALRNHGFAVWHEDWEVAARWGTMKPVSSSVPNWLLNALGTDHFFDVVGVHVGALDRHAGTGSSLGRHETESVIYHASRFPHLEQLVLGRITLTPEGLARLGEMKNLKYLALKGDVDADWLSERLPGCQVQVSRR